MGISPGRRCAEWSSAVRKSICEGTPDLVHEFLAFVPPGRAAKLNFGKYLLPRQFHPVNLRSPCVVRAPGTDEL